MPLQPPPSHRLSGHGLHGGAATWLTLRRYPGATSLAVGAAKAPLYGLEVRRADGGVRVALGRRGPEVDLIEHLAAAVAGLGLWEGVLLEVAGGEVPLLDGGARDIAAALGSFGLRASPAPLRVARPFSFSVGDSAYTIAPAATTSVHVEIVFAHPAIGRMRASWQGDANDFASRIAPARTFGFASDEAALRSRGRAARVDTEAVVVFTETGLLRGCKLAGRDEPARHKLLDLIGDLALYGGPPRGEVHATRPGHDANHAFARAALRAGALVPTALAS